MPATMRGTPSWSLGGLLTALLAVTAQLAMAYTLDPDSIDSITTTAQAMTQDLMSFYNGDQPGGTPGMLPFPPYYWWESGAMWGCMIDYWYYTRDTTWNQQTMDGLLFQVGPNNDYMPPNQTLTEGNDDQGFWGLAVMSAAEYNFPNPPAGQPQWLALAQAVFNTQASRWDTANCNGGLRWQIFTWNNGYDYKNSISQACFFALSARLALYTGNSSYGDWAEKTWDWMVATKFMDSSYYIYDGAHIETNCTNIVPYQWTYNAGAFILGAAAMYNYTGSDVWQSRVEGLVKGAGVFFTGNGSDIMTEVACETVNECDLDQHSFKAYLSRWLAASTKWAPFITDSVMPWLRASAIAAAAQCTGGSNGRMCGLVWTNNGQWDGSTGAGQQMDAMEIVLANMVATSGDPVTATTGGNSTGNAGAGASDFGQASSGQNWKPITAGDRAGAWILTLLAIFGLICGVIFMFLDENSQKSPSERLSDFKAALLGGVGVGVAAAVLRKRRPGGLYTEKGKTLDTTSSSGESVRSHSGIAREVRGSILPTHNTNHPEPRTPNPPGDVAYAPAGRNSGIVRSPIVPLTARERRLSMQREGYAKRLQRRSEPPIYK